MLYEVITLGHGRSRARSAEQRAVEVGGRLRAAELDVDEEAIELERHRREGECRIARRRKRLVRERARRGVTLGAAPGCATGLEGELDQARRQRTRAHESYNFV